MGHTEGPDLAHRLRTPLAVIVGYIEILALRDRDGENAEILQHLREAAADVLKYLGPKDIQRIGAAMSQVGQLTVAQVSGTLSTFLNAVEDQASVGVGSDDYIRNTLTRALGEDKAAPLMRYVAAIQSQRGDYNGRVLSIRQDDLRTLSVIFDLQPSILVDQLIEWGVLDADGRSATIESFWNSGRVTASSPL